MRFWRWGYLFWVALVILVAHFSGYRADSVLRVNWDVIFMLTPVGLVENLFFGLHSYLHRYYFVSPPGLRLVWDQPAWNWHYLYIYAQSNLLEVFPLLLVYPRWNWRTVGSISILNSVTHPIVFFLLMKLSWGYLWAILLSETFAIVAEGFVYWRLGYRRPWTASLFANFVSWQVAPAITAYVFLWDRFVV